MVNLLDISFYWMSYCQPPKARRWKFTSFSRTIHWLIVHVKAASSWDSRIHCSQPVATEQPGH